MRKKAENKKKNLKKPFSHRAILSKDKKVNIKQK